MIFKMRILFHSKAGNAEVMAQAISREQKAGSDKIPPAYPCESEKLLFIGVEPNGKKPDQAVVDFCQGLNPQRAKNVAFFAAGSSFEALDELIALVKKKGLTIAGEPYKCEVKGGLFKKGKVTDADIKGAVDWSNKIVKSLTN